MKIERRTNSCFMSHNHIAVFVNRTGQNEAVIRVNKGLHGITENPQDPPKIENWITIGEMSATKEELRDFLNLIAELMEM